MTKKWIKYMVLSMVLICLSGSVSSAAESGTVFSVNTEEDRIILYVENPGGQPELQCQIGTSMCENVTVSPITEETVPVETIFLIDNSLSVTENYRADIADILTQLAANRLNGELFTVAVFSTEIQYLLEDSSDYSQIKAVLESITYQDQETYLTDVLYELLEELKGSEKQGLKRIVIVSDGVDNKALGYTKEELYTLLSEKICPLYTLGCTYRDNSEELKNMFALSRMTEGQSWLLDDVADNMEVVNGIAALNDALKVTIVPKAEDCDGSTKGISLVLSGSEGTLQYSLETRMPFSQNALNDVEKTNEDLLSGQEILEETDSSGSNEVLNPVVKTPDNSFVPYIVAGTALLLAVVAICVTVLKKRSKKGKKDDFAAAPVSEITGSAQQPKSVTRAVRVVPEQEKKPKESERKTLYFWGKKIYLTDLNDPKKEFSAMLKNGELLAGWDSDCQICIRYNDTVSGKHLSICEKNGEVMVKNLSRTNPLEINGKTAEGEVELHTGDILTLGEVNMKVRIEG